MYMKILQSALVELINRDYADFVNLSSNLVSYISCFIVAPVNKLYYPLYQLCTCKLHKKNLRATSSLLISVVTVIAVSLSSS